MPYSSLADLSERYGAAMLIDLTDRGEVATGAIDTDVVERAIAEADALIDGYLRARYVLPMDPVPSLIGTLSRQIAIYTLHTFDPSDKIKDEHSAALRQLEQIARGSIQLGVAGVETPTNSGGGARTTDRDRPMTADNLKGFI